MNYGRIYEYQELRLDSMIERSKKLTEHLLEHPMDYQARNASIILDSNIQAKRRELAKIEYLIKVQLYT